MVAQERINVRETVGRKNNCKLNFFSTYFVRNNEEYICLLKIADTSFKLQQEVLIFNGTSCVGAPQKTDLKEDNFFELQKSKF